MAGEANELLSNFANRLPEIDKQIAEAEDTIEFLASTGVNTLEMRAQLRTLKEAQARYKEALAKRGITA